MRQAQVAIELGRECGPNTTVYVGKVGDRVKGQFDHATDLDPGLNKGLAEYQEIRSAHPDASVLVHCQDVSAMVPACQKVAEINGFDHLVDPAHERTDSGAPGGGGDAGDLPMELPAPSLPEPQGSADISGLLADRPGG